MGIECSKLLNFLTHKWTFVHAMSHFVCNFKSVSWTKLRDNYSNYLTSFECCKSIWRPSLDCIMYNKVISFAYLLSFMFYLLSPYVLFFFGNHRQTQSDDDETYTPYGHSTNMHSSRTLSLNFFFLFFTNFTHYICMYVYIVKIMVEWLLACLAMMRSLVRKFGV